MCILIGRVSSYLSSAMSKSSRQIENGGDGAPELNYSVIAREAGVSRGVVSAFFSGRYYSMDRKSRIGIGAATRAKIKETCLRLNYIPKDPALFFLLYPEKADVGFMLNHLIPDGYGHPYFSLVLDGVNKKASSLEVSVSNFFFDHEHDYMIDPTTLPAPILSGAIKKVLVAGGRQNYSLFSRLNDMGVSVVQLGHSSGIAGTVSVVPDYRGVARLAITRLIEKGHRHIAVVADAYYRPDYYQSRELNAGCREAMATIGIDFKDSDVLIKKAIGYESPSSIIPTLMARKPRPTAVYCYHDWAARSLISSMPDYGLQVPEDFSVVGTEDDRISQTMRPGLSTVHIPHRRLGERAMTELNRIVVDGCEKHEEIVLPVEYVERETVRSL